MDEADRRMAESIQHTRVVRTPKQHLATFGVSRLRYYIVTEPTYADISPSGEESVIRDGTVESQRPAVVTPTYMLNLEGFSESARHYMESLVDQMGANSPGILYRYRNEPGGLEIVGGKVPVVAKRIADDLDERGDDMASVILGADDLWDVSLLKFIYDYTANSLAYNVGEMRSMGLLDHQAEAGVPRAVTQRIEEMFSQARQGLDPKELKAELDRWGLFEHYQDRFFGLFR